LEEEEEEEEEEEKEEAEEEEDDKEDDDDDVDDEAQKSLFVPVEENMEALRSLCSSKAMIVRLLIKSSLRSTVASLGFLGAGPLALDMDSVWVTRHVGRGHMMRLRSRRLFRHGKQKV